MTMTKSNGVSRRDFFKTVGTAADAAGLPAMSATEVLPAADHGHTAAGRAADTSASVGRRTASNRGTCRRTGLSQAWNVLAIDVGLQAMRDWFAREAGHVRVVGVMSSTCPMCVRGRQEGLEPLLAEPGDLRMAWVFIDMLETDSRASAHDVAAGSTDSRLSVLHDPAQLLGHVMARCLGWTGHVA
jgi:hypothetical protein